MDDCRELLDSENPVLSIGTPLSWLYAGPKDLLLYTLVLGVLTVLAIKEVWSIACVSVKGRSPDLHIDRVVRWNLIENCEDLRKTFQRILLPCAKDLYRRLPFVKGEGKIKPNGWKLVLYSFSIALALFAFDVGIVVLGAPSLHLIAASDIQSLTWANNGLIPTLNKTSDVLQGSFSRTIVKESVYNDIEMIRHSSVSLERTDILDFKSYIGNLPSYGAVNKTFFECDAVETWRIRCRAYTNNRLYQYKLRLDVLTDSADSYFIPVSKFSHWPNATNPLESYVRSIREQLFIDASIAFRNSTTFRLRAETQPREWTHLKRDKRNSVLTHDAIVTLFLGSIRICAGRKNATLQWRKKGQRKTLRKSVGGFAAKSQRPRFSLLMTAFMYMFLAFVSMLLQGRIRVDQVAKDMDIVFELYGQVKDPETGVLNITAPPLKVATSKTVCLRGEHEDHHLLHVRDHEDDPERVFIEHEGFLPASLLKHIWRFMRHRQNHDTRRLSDEWGMVIKDDFE